MPTLAAFLRISASDSPNVIKRQRSPRVAPVVRNCRPSVVLPQPGPPRKRYVRRGMNPPSRISSSPRIPVDKRPDVACSKPLPCSAELPASRVVDTLLDTPCDTPFPIVVTMISSSKQDEDGKQLVGGLALLRSLMRISAACSRHVHSSSMKKAEFSNKSSA